MFTTRPELHGRFGMVAATHWLASGAGTAILERGGNAFDAAVAAGFTLQVVEPHMNGPGGEVPILFQAAGRPPQVLCGQGPAPAAASPEAFSGTDRIPGTGVLPACVPGAFDAWLVLLRDHGRLTLRDVLTPAIGHARDGYPLPHRAAEMLAAVRDVFAGHWPSSAELWLSGGRPPAGGSLHRNPELAATYRRIVTEAENGASGREAQIERARRLWREGFVAGAILDFLASPVPDASGEPHRGLLTGEDLASWSAGYEDPVSLEYAGRTVHKTGPWGQGPVFLQQLRILERLGIEGVSPESAEFVHLVAEAAKLALADREAWYADPDFADVPLRSLLSTDYAAARSRLVTGEAAMELRPGSPEGRAPYVVPPRLAGRTPVAPGTSGEPVVAPVDPHRGDTCHLDVVDAEGNMVSATPSGGWFSSSPAIPGLGFPLGTRGQMFWLDPRSPGVVAPGKRPRTTLSPTLVTVAGEGVLALGTPGGDQQDQWSLTCFLRMMHGGTDMQRAMDSPMFHTTAVPGSFYPREMTPGGLVVESRFGTEAIAELRLRGHRVTVADGWSLGRLTAVARDPERMTVHAAADPRGAQCYAMGR